VTLGDKSSRSSAQARWCGTPAPSRGVLASEKGRLVLAHVYRQALVASFGAGQVGDDRRQAEELLTAQRRRPGFSLGRSSVSTVLRVAGFASSPRTNGSICVDLLIVGSRGAGPLGRLINGSTSTYLAVFR
jgi:hypothetical protein